MFHIHTSEDAVFLWPTFSRSGVHAQAAAAPFDQTEAWTRASSAVCGSCLCVLGKRTHAQDMVASRVWQANAACHLCLIADGFFEGRARYASTLAWQISDHKQQRS
jgi:hypothetical protein